MEIGKIANIQINSTYLNSFGSKLQIQHTQQNKQISKTKNAEISFNESLRILWSGIKKQGKDIIKSFSNVQNLIPLIAVPVALSSLVLCGIPMSVSGGALAILFATVATAKTLKHTSEFIRNNKSKEYDNARKNLETLGEDSVDLALSLPFTPAAVSKLKMFSKFGKIKFDKEFFQNNKWHEIINKIFSHYNTEQERKIIFKKTMNNELKRVSMNERANIAKELEDYNVSLEQIPNVVLDKWAEANKIYTKPILHYDTLSSDTAGATAVADCKIIINNYRKTSPPSKQYKTLNVRQIGNEYRYTYEEISTGKRFEEIVPAFIIEDYNSLTNQYRQCSPELKRILTTLHEREHIDQIARLMMLKGINIIKPTNTGKNLYNKMVQEITAQGINIQKNAETLEMVDALRSKNSTFAVYVKNKMEIGARKAEIKALKEPLYQHLDNICKEVNKHDIKTACPKAISTNLIRGESLNS